MKEVVWDSHFNVTLSKTNTCLALLYYLPCRLPKIRFLLNKTVTNTYLSQINKTCEPSLSQDSYLTITVVKITKIY